MAENTKIQWTDHSFSPWHGCVRVHAGCVNCYAEAYDVRYQDGRHWGPQSRSTRRMILGEWSKPERWNRLAAKAGERHRVFIASMSDIFEDFTGKVDDHLGHPVVCPDGEMRERYSYLLTERHEWTVPGLRRRTFDLFEGLTSLIVMLLTKRPQNVLSMVPSHWMERWPSHVKVGTSPCNQETAEASIPDLLKVRDKTGCGTFLSCEPMIGPIDFFGKDSGGLEWPMFGLAWSESNVRYERLRASSIDEIIIGGESGKGARPCEAAWIASLIDQGKLANVPVYVKQLGSRPAGAAKIKDPKGGDPAEWPAHLRVREQATW